MPSIVKRIMPCLLLLALALTAFPQDAEENAPIPGEGTFNENPYEVGENILTFNLGLSVPFTYYDLSGGNFIDTQLLFPGVAFSISYLQTLSTGFALGGEIGGGVNTSIADRVLFIAPFTMKAAWIFVFMPFELMPTVSAGMVIVKLQESLHFDPIIKPGITFSWRQSLDWSFGLNANLWIIPQFYPDPSQNMIGCFGELTLCAAYHF